MLRDHVVTHGTGAQADWPRVLDRYGVQYLVLDRVEDSSLLRRFRTEPHWLVDLEGRESVLLVRTKKRREAPSTAGLGYLEETVDR